MRRVTKGLPGVIAAAALAGGALGAHAAPLPTWADQMESLKDVGPRLLAKAERGDTEAHRQEMYKYILGAVANGYLNYVNADPGRPTWTPLWNHDFNYGGPNPDYAYMFTMVDPKGVYRISGFRGTSRFVEITQQATDFTQMAPGGGIGPSPTNDLDQLKLGKDGYFSVILSAQRPAGYDGDWWPLAPTTAALLMRKASYDWKGETDPRIAIDRLDYVAPPTPAQMAARFSNLKAWVTTMIEYDISLTRYYRDHHGINTIKKSDLMAKSDPFKGQIYLDGAFQIGDDEALVLDTAVPKTCRYWQILLADNRFATVDWVNHQSSLNGYQARLDADGRFRAVIAARDPGVPNWLDTGGEAWGIIQMRWNRCSDAPTPQVTKVALKDVRKYLPADTPAVSPAQRQEALRARREAAQLRQLW